MLYQSETLSVYWLDNGLAELCFDSPGSVNKLDTTTLTCLSEAIALLEQEKKLTGLLLSSGKSSFIAGADINEFLPLFGGPAETLTEWLKVAHTLFNRLEDLPVPTLSAIDGYALGGGCECILATDYRIATPEARIGLPETKLGIMPGFGGTVRLPRIIGADNAIEMITTGKELRGYQALNIGLVDAVVEAENLHDCALKMLKQAVSMPGQWSTRRQPKLQPLALSPVEQKMSFTTAKAMVRQQAGAHYPAPGAAVNTIEAAANLSRNEAIQQEINAFVPLARSPEAHALIGLFLNDQYVKGVAKKISAHHAAPSQVAVIGAGIMGGGIAYQAATRGATVSIRDINQHALEAGMGEAGKLLNQQLARGRIDSDEMIKVLSRIRPALSKAGVDAPEIVVEAVIENPQVKTVVLSETENQVDEQTILASNTSTIPVTQLAQGLQRPEMFCGMHFFNPVHRMPLVEVIRGAKTAEQTIARVVAWARQMGKTPIIVNDCPGFFVNRVLFPYFAGFCLLLRDGADFRQVDRVMEKRFGWPMGPAQLLDVVGIDTAHHAQQVMAEGFPDRMQKTGRDAIDALFDAGRFGQKNQRGFYRWEKDKKGKAKKVDDPAVNDLLQPVCQPARPFSDDEIIARMMIPMLNEVTRCLEEKIIASPAEADMALVYGLGFPPFHGGACRYLDKIGNHYFAELARQYESLGDLYHLSGIQQQKAQHNASWYPAVNTDSANASKMSEE